MFCCPFRSHSFIFIFSVTNETELALHDATEEAAMKLEAMDKARALGVAHAQAAAETIAAQTERARADNTAARATEEL